MKLLRRAIALILLLCLCLPFFSCRSVSEEDLTPDQVMEAYEDSGYTTKLLDHTDESGREEWDFDYQFYVESEDGHQLNFYFYRDVSSAENARKRYSGNLLTFLFSCIYGSPTWPRARRWGKTVASYEDLEMIRPLDRYLRARS